MLGTAFTRLLLASDRTIISPTLAQLDIASEQSVAAYAKSLPACAAVINCAAWTDVDGAETHEAKATEVNGAAMNYLLALAARVDAPLISYGTDYVFKGTSAAPYTINEPLAPLNAYGRSKAVGERALIGAANSNWLHMRTSWLYAPWGKNFVKTIASLVQTKPSLKVVADQRGRPTSAEHLAHGTMRLLALGARGVWHVTDGGECTWHEFALEIARITKASGKQACDVLPCTTDEFPRPAKRPAYSVLDITATSKALGEEPAHWKQHLADVMPRMA